MTFQHLHFQASEDCDVTVINTISSESDFCHPTTQAASRVLAGKALSCRKSDMWRKVKSKELRRVVNILKRMMKFTISKRTRTPGFIVEFISLLYDQKLGSRNDTITEILSKMKEFLEEGHQISMEQVDCTYKNQKNLCLEPWACEPIRREVFITVLDILLSNRENRLLAPSSNQDFKNVIDRTTKLLACRKEIESRQQSRVNKNKSCEPMSDALLSR